MFVRRFIFLYQTSLQRGAAAVHLLHVRDDNQRLLFNLHRRLRAPLRDDFDVLGPNGGFRLDDDGNASPRFNGELVVLRLAAYPEGAVGHADSSPGDGHGVLERGGGRVGAGVQPVAFAPHLHLHGEPLGILDRHGGDGQRFRKNRTTSG